MNTIKITTSNINKITEMKRFLGEDRIEVLKGADIKEVAGTCDEVIEHKAKDTGDSYAVEDTILYVNGKEQVDIRYQDLENFLNEGDRLKWVTSYGYNINGIVYIYRAEQEGYATLTRKVEKGFAFDPFFVPAELYESFKKGEDNTTLHELSMVQPTEDTTGKDLYSARIKALTMFQEGNYLYKKTLERIGEWTGAYQND